MVYTISPNKAVGYKPSKPVPVWSGSSFNRKQVEKTEKVKALGNRVVKPRTLSYRTKQKIRDKIEAMYLASPRKFALVTLSFINKVEDKQAQKCLNKFLTMLRLKKKNCHYVWVAERQKENKKYPDNIHFHLVVNQYMDKDYWNNLWIKQQYNEGIEYEGLSIENVRELALANKLKEYLNPFDVKGVNAVNGLAIYLTAYITKNNDTFECSGWHVSRGVSRLFTKVLISSKDYQELSSKKNQYLNKKDGTLYQGKAMVFDHCTVTVVYNKKYFSKKHMLEMHEINSAILEGWKPKIIPQANYDVYETLIEQEKKPTEFWYNKCLEKSFKIFGHEVQFSKS